MQIILLIMYIGMYSLHLKYTTTPDFFFCVGYYTHRWTVLQVMNSYVNTYCLFSYLFQPELSSHYRRRVRQGKDGKLHHLQGTLKVEMIRNNCQNLTL